MKKHRNPHRYKKRKPVYRNRFFWLFILILILFSSLFYFLFFSDFFQIKKININDLEYLNKDNINLLINKEAKNKILFFSSKSIFLANISKTKKSLLNNFPEIASIKISRNFPSSLNILIEERKELAIFCATDREEENCFFIDKEGVIFKKAGQKEPLIKIIDKRGIIVSEIGKRAINKDKLNWILKINIQLEDNLNILIKEFIVFPEKLVVSVKDGWNIYFNFNSDMDWQITKLKALLENRISEEQRKNLEYIELRFGNFANPKFLD